MARMNQKQFAAVQFVDRGVITIVASVEDTKTLKSSVDIVYQKGGVSHAFTPCNDDGVEKLFGDLDDVVSWVKGAIYDLNEIIINIPNAELISKVYVPPTDSVKYATAQVAMYQKLSAGIDDNVSAATNRVAADVLAGWNLPTAHTALQARAAENVTQKATVDAIKAFYLAKIAEFQAIVTAGG